MHVSKAIAIVFIHLALGHADNGGASGTNARHLLSSFLPPSGGRWSICTIVLPRRGLVPAL
jgi:hypothetical protein